jgi:flagellar hook-associated protein 3 FlgL
MVTLPIQLDRVSNLLQSNVATQNIDSTQQSLINVEQELTTGKAVNQPSDNPSAAAVIQQLQKTLDYRTQYSTNITSGSDQLNEVGSTLGDVTTLITQAQSIASANVSSITSSDARASAATVVDSLYNQALSLANTSYEGNYLFGGTNAQNAPYTQTAAGTQYDGVNSTLSNTFEEATTLSFQVTGQQVFGGQSASVSAGTDISPSVAATDRISDLAGTTGNGVTLGTIQIGNGTTTTSVDLTNASSLGDVINDINAAGINGVTASLSQYGIKLTATGGANITVTDPQGSSTAGDLGIATPAGGGANVAVNGNNIGAKITDFTPLASLRGGAGLDTTGFNISNGTQTKTISLTGLNTVQDLVNAVNDSGLGVQAQISSDGTGIDLTNNTQGASLSVSENGGTTATELGFRTFTPATLLSSLNGGNGVSTPAGNQFSITSADGTVTNISLTNASTVQDVIDQINTAAGGKVTASFATTGNGIVLTDNTTGTGALSVASINSSTTAADLGLTTPANGNTITGKDVNPVGAPGLLGDLQKLSAALRSNDTDGITAAAQSLASDAQTVTDVNGSVGARVQELNDRSSDITTENVATQSLLSQFQDVDYTTAVTQYQTLQTSLQASLQVTSKTLSLSLLDYLQ